MVERFLQAWDPIGVIQDGVKTGVPPTEYDSYAPKILGLLIKGISIEELANELSSIRTKQMGLTSKLEDDKSFAKGLMLWWNEYK